MRIAQVVDTLEMGGLERMALDLAMEQKASGHEAHVYCLLRAGALAKEAEAAGIPVSVFHKQPGLSLRLLAQLAWRFFRDGIEVAHSHDPNIHHYAAVAARMAGVPVVVNTRHGPATSSGGSFNERWFRMALPFTDAVVFVSEQARRTIMERSGLSERMTSVIPNGIRVERFMRRPAAPGSAWPRIRFGTVGRLVQAKGHATLIDAFQRLRERLPTAVLQIAGGGPLRGELQEQVARLGLEECVTLAGACSDVAGFLSELDIFVFSSRNEGLPMAILEAMAAGLPIVSTRVGGVPEVVPEGEVGWFCPADDAASLAAAMYTAAVSPDLAQRGQRATRLALERYTTAAMNRNYETVYRRCLK
jgi:glycosyltransferase involved in cell wall biosynthesis